MKPTAERVRELFSYDPETGALTWRVARGKMQPGDTAGCSDGKGHWVVGFDYGFYQAGPVIWLYVTGEMPPERLEVDHKDGNGENNRWKNLRLATHKQNLENLSRSGQGRVGFRGICWEQPRQKWQARIEHYGRVHRLGRYDSLLDAIAARLRAERSLFTHHREH